MNSKKSLNGGVEKTFTEKEEKEVSPEHPKVIESFLSEFIKNCSDASDFLSSHIREAENLKERLYKGRLHLAVVGQFKRGKSTFINALLQAEILPTSVVPATAIPTFIEFGSEPKCTIFFKNESKKTYNTTRPEELRDFLSRYVTEKHNPHNREGVERVVVSYPSPLLQTGLVIIDTPGIGSTHTHNTEATLRFLPQCDVTFIILSPDPPITEIELSFFKKLISKVSRVFVVINKKDLLSSKELEELTHFISEVLISKANFPRDISIISVSSKEALTNRGENSFLTSGYKELWEKLSTFIKLEKDRSLEKAIKIKLSNLLSDAIFSLNLAITSLTSPICEVEQLLEKLKKIQETIKREEAQIIDLLVGDQKRLCSLLEEQAKQLRKESEEFLYKIIENSEDKRIFESMERVRNIVSENVNIFFDKKLEEMSILFDKKVREILSSYNEKVNNIVEDIREKAAEMFGIKYARRDRSLSMEIEHTPYWTTDKWSSSLSPFPEGFFDGLLPKTLKIKVIKKRTSRYIEEIVMSNVENLRYATLLNLNATFRKFQYELKNAIKDVVEITSGIIESAIKKRSVLAEENKNIIDNIKTITFKLEKQKEELSVE